MFNRQSQVAPFSPHEIYITPHIGVMLLDLGLVTESEWESLVGPRPAPDSLDQSPSGFITASMQ